MNKNFTILIVNHGEFGKSLVESTELIVGDIDDIYVFSLKKEMSLEELIYDLETCIKDIEDEVIILTDLYGGTPNNAATYLQKKYNCGVVTGVNMPMLLELIMSREQNRRESLVDLAETAGKFGVVNFNCNKNT